MRCCMRERTYVSVREKDGYTIETFNEILSNFKLSFQRFYTISANVQHLRNKKKQQTFNLQHLA